MKTRNPLALAVAFAVAGGAQAADWEWNPTVEAGYLYDDNYRLTQPGTEVDVQGGLLDAQLEMRALMPRGEFSFTPRVRATYFPDAQDLDSQDYFATLAFDHDGQRAKSRIRAEFAQQDVINSEQPGAGVDSGLGEPDFGDSGRVFERNRRMRASLRPQLDYELSARRALQFTAEYSDVSFDREIGGAQVGYTTAGATAGLITRLSERSSLTTRVLGERFDIDSQDVTNSYGAELQWDTRTAAETRTFLRAGAQSVDVQSGGTETAWLAGGGVSFLAGRNQLFADLARSVGPSSAGAVVTRDQIRVRWTRDMTPRFSLLAGLRGTHDDAVDTASTFVERKYATGDVGFQWRWQEEFALRFAYDYTWQEYSDSLDDATSSGAMVTILYQPAQRRRPRND